MYTNSFIYILERTVGTGPIVMVAPGVPDCPKSRGHDPTSNKSFAAGMDLLVTRRRGGGGGHDMGLGVVAKAGLGSKRL